jgi:O-acetyl-ADP-ribose deacetylase (regulator of RNase III)
MSIQYLIGDATEPVGPGIKIIAHCCNDAGGWGSGFVIALSNRFGAITEESYYVRPQEAYTTWYSAFNSDDNGERKRARRWLIGMLGLLNLVPFELGEVQYVPVKGKIIVANIIGQHGYGYVKDQGNPPIRYDAIQRGLESIRDACIHTGDIVSVHMPRMGAGLAGGEWSKIEKIINETLVRAGISVYVYDLPNETDKWPGTKYVETVPSSLRG